MSVKPNYSLGTARGKNLTVKSDGCSNGNCVIGGRGYDTKLVSELQRLMLGVVRHGRKMMLPVPLGAHGARRWFGNAKVTIRCFVAVPYTRQSGSEKG